MSAEATEAISPRLAAIDEEHLSRSVLRLAWPVVVQQVSFTMVQLVDTLLVGHLGSGPLAGVGIGSVIFWFPLAGAMAVGVGATAVVARNIGAGEVERASRTLRTAMIMSIAWGVAAAALLWLTANWLLTMMGARPEAVDPGTIYMRAAAYGLPLYCLLYAGNACLQGAGDTRTPMLIMLVVNVVNAVVAYILIYGPGPLPAYGVIGSGLGYTVGAIAGAAIVVTVLVRSRRGLRYDMSHPIALDRTEMKRILTVGLPVGLEQIQFNAAFLVYTRIISSLGTAAMAAHQVALRIEGLAFNPAFALGVAATTLVGQSLGARRPDLAERAAVIAARWAVLLMTTVGFALALLGEPIISLFVNEADVIDIGRRLLLILAFAMPALAVSLTLGGGLRGAGDTRAVLGIATFGLWGVRLVPSYLFAVAAGFGVPGAWCAAVLDINTRGLLMWLRFRQGRWKQIKV